MERSKKKKKKEEDTAPPKVLCYYCDKEFDSEQILKDHQKSEHFKCPICHEDFLSMGGTAVHVLQAHNERQAVPPPPPPPPPAKIPNATPDMKSTLQLLLTPTCGDQDCPGSPVKNKEAVEGPDKQDERTFRTASGFKSTYPCFTVTLKKSHLYKLNIPNRFAEEHLPTKSLDAKVLESNGKTWDVHYQYSKDASCICKGWNFFLSQNKLTEGDVCVFELIDNEEIKLKVSINP